MNLVFEEVPPTVGQAQNLVVMLHGIASDAQELVNFVPQMQSSLNQTHFISLNAPERYDMGIFGYQWFSARKWDEIESRQEGLSKVVPEVVKFLEDKTKELNLKFEDVFLFGFSQGSMVATYAAMSIDHKFAGIIGIGGPITPIPLFEGNNQIPICLIHGACDRLIRIEEMYKGKKYLSDLGFDVQTHEIPLLRHLLDTKCIEIAVNFIKDHHAG